MRKLAAIVLVAACGQRAAQLATPPPVPAPPPLELVRLDAAGVATSVRWTEQMKIWRPTEDIGLFAFAQRKTVLHAGDHAVGWLEPGARVGILAATPDRVEVVLFAWDDSESTKPVHAWVDPHDLGPAAPHDAPPFSRATHSEQLVAHGQYFRRLDDTPMGYTFCGTVEVLGRDPHPQRLHVVMREDGVVLEGLVDDDAIRKGGACPGLLVVEKDDHTREVRYHGRWRAYPDAALPAELVEPAPISGPTFAQLVAKRTTVYWLVEWQGNLQCQAWTLAPPKRPDDYGDVVSRMKLEDGDTLITHFGLDYTSAADTTVTLLGPTSVIAPPGRQPHGGLSFGCGHEYQVVSSDAGALTMYADPPMLPGRIRAYVPGETEKWYLDRARCEGDAKARTQRVALAPGPHQGC